MRERIIKCAPGQNNSDRKDVRIRINSSGRNVRGEKRYALAVRFAGGSEKKCSSNGYVGVEIDREIHRIYFVPASPEEGFKLTAPKTTKSMSISFKIDDPDKWKDTEGCYFLLKDVEEGIYYIDYSHR